MAVGCLNADLDETIAQGEMIPIFLWMAVSTSIKLSITKYAHLSILVMENQNGILIVLPY